jgi:hypothetical protein
MPGPTPVPGETLNIYDGSKVYWYLIPVKDFPEFAPTIEFTALNGNVVKINRQTGAIIP